MAMAAKFFCSTAWAGIFGFGIGDGEASNQRLIPQQQSKAAPKSSATTDVSDLWWNPAESGWGMQLVQNNNIVFATLFVYGSDSRPTWFSATLNNVGNFTWSGQLYATIGPWFASPLFDPAQVGVRPVGNLTFHATSITTGTVTYTVDGASVSKTIVRQTLASESIAGVYDLVVNQTQTCTPPISSGQFVGSTVMTISQVGTNVVMQNSGAASGTCTLTGSYSQSGKLGAVAGNYSCTWGENGAFSVYEITVTETGLIARLSEHSNLCSSITGDVAGIRR
jgi:hypothetical protein